MAKLIIGSPETAEKETEVRFWLEDDNGTVRLLANAGRTNQILLSIESDGGVGAVGIACPALAAFFSSYGPLSGL